jgi:peptide/nickel transport system ATP-binding protein
LLDAVRLPSDIASSFPRGLSGGQRQRVAIARAFCATPKIVVLDEPTSALDVSVQATVLNLLNDLQAGHGTAYLFISHDLKVVRYMADRIGVLYRGQLVETGAADRIFEGPNHPYTTSLLSSALAAPILLEDPTVTVERGCHYADRCPFVLPKCRDVPPPKRTDGDDHIISCWHDISELKGLARLPHYQSSAETGR